MAKSQTALTASDINKELAERREKRQGLKETMNVLSGRIEEFRKDSLHLDDVQRALAWGAAYQDVKWMLVRSQLWPMIKSLEGDQDGFKTDGKPYTDAVLAGAVCTALLHGYRLVGNEFNVLVGKAYFTKEGVRRKLRDDYGVNPELTIGEPTTDGNVHTVPGRATFQFKGEQRTIDRFTNNQRLRIKAYGTDNPAIVEGKAVARLLKLVLEYVSGKPQEGVLVDETDEPEDESVVVDATSDPKYDEVRAQYDQETVERASGDIQRATEIQVVEQLRETWMATANTDVAKAIIAEKAKTRIEQIAEARAAGVPLDEELEEI